MRIAAFRSTALHLLPPVLQRLRARYPGIEPQVRIVGELGRGTAGEVADGRADLAIATVEGAQLPPGLVVSGLFEESYSLVHPAGYPAHARCRWLTGSRTPARTPASGGAHRTGSRGPTIEAEDDGAVLSLVSRGHGVAIMPALSLVGATDSIEITDLGPERPTRRVGYVTTPELARSAIVRALVRELRNAGSAI
ncbi:LysR family transcriptional regulator substrate-binding protein [Streptomyces werraensis]|uniref:LysR family transcriptional regulator substrate-binding protein n=1 Tax=Streptomyces werraensis TaxID=68284 RepID=UPI0038185E5B